MTSVHVLTPHGDLEEILFVCTLLEILENLMLGFLHSGGTHFSTGTCVFLNEFTQYLKVLTHHST